MNAAARSKKKAQISVYLDQPIMKMLADYAARRDQPQSLIAKRLDQLDRRMIRLERDVDIAVETLAVFIRFWLATTPTLPEPAAQAARAKAGELYDAFVAALGRRLAKGPKLQQEIAEDVGTEEGK
ncbi:CopG family transcriptional regulator [Candidatus Raskinella chloraquaticus]|uniref:CopG family transcriptional regulator n=1 Tax=Candidatus Raskinella chloraquaticus TaxID=1951219 RepID=A0A1W9HXL8_9HYPH|nr:MAG: CopG family transcriptional regulator [Proteobacteria bacterium SG_bin8]